jgi:hypothetical protein
MIHGMIGRIWNLQAWPERRVIAVVALGALASGVIGCSADESTARAAPEEMAVTGDEPESVPLAAEAVPPPSGGTDYVFEEVKRPARRFALTVAPGESEREAVARVPGLVLAAAEGTAVMDVLWDDPRASGKGALAVLEAAGVPVAGEVMEFVMKRPAGMEVNCPSCLYSSYEAARNAPGVRDVRVFLGDPENRRIELVVDPDAVAAAGLAAAMRVRHAHDP